MKKYKISEALGNISARYIAEAAYFTAEENSRSKKAIIVKWISLAACICLLLTGVYAAYLRGIFGFDVSDGSNSSSDTPDASSPDSANTSGVALTLKDAVNAVHFKELFTFEGYQPNKITYNHSASGCEVSYSFGVNSCVSVRAVEYHNSSCTLDNFVDTIGDFDPYLYHLKEQAQTELGYKYNLYSCIENNEEAKSEIVVLNLKRGESDIFFCIRFDLYGENTEYDVKALINRMKLIDFADSNG